jgi:Flp pilus assembly protein TadD
MSRRRSARKTVPSPSLTPPTTKVSVPLGLIGILVFVAGAAWLSGDWVVRRQNGARLPVRPDLSGLPSAVRRHIEDADAAARAGTLSAEKAGDLAMAYHASTLPEAAQQAYAAAETIAPADARWPYYAGLLFEERGEHDAARLAFSRATAIDADHGLAWFHLAEIAFKEANAEDARAAYVRARDARPAAPFAPAGVQRRVQAPLAAYASLGLVRLTLERGARDEARKMLAEIVQAHPGFGVARRMMLQLDGQDADSPSTASTPSTYVPPPDPWLDAVVARSQSTDLLLKHAAIAGRAGDRTWREFLVRRSLTASPEGLDVLMEAASMLQDANRHDEALQYLRRAETVAPGDHHLMVEQGRSLADLNRLAEAEAVLRRAVRVRDAAAEYNLGTVLDRLDRWDEARQHYERALAINPFHARALNNLAVGLDRHGQTPVALGLYARAMQADPDNAEVYSNFGSALIGQERFAEAVRMLEIAVAMEPSAANAHNNLGIALAQSQRFSEARRSFEEALRLEPAHENARRNLAAIAARQ